MCKTFMLVAVIFCCSAVHAITVSTVKIGDIGNAADVTGYGAVNYSFSLGQYEITNAQYAGFLNAIAKLDTHQLFHPMMQSNPIGGISRSGASGSYVYTAKPEMSNKPGTMFAIGLPLASSIGYTMGSR